MTTIRDALKNFLAVTGEGNSLATMRVEIWSAVTYLPLANSYPCGIASELLSSMVSGYGSKHFEVSA